MTTAITAAALRHAANGRPVFPCWPDKSPRTSGGFHGATLDRRRIVGWFEGVPDALLGIPTGKASGLVVIDVDGDEGWESLRDLEQKHAVMPRTASVKTPSAGQHFYFKWPGAEVRCSAGKLGPNLDVRGDGGYVCAPPSPGYEVDEQAPAAPLPSWLRELLVTPTNGRPRTPPSEWVALLRDGATEGKRNDSLARIVGHLLRCNVHVDLVAELVHLVNRDRFRPPLARDEVDRVIASIAAAELRRRRN